MIEKEEQAFLQGERVAYQSLLGLCLRKLHDDPAAMRERWAAEREAAIAVLRSICRRHGDNNWTDDLPLADILNKHLGNHLSM